MAEENKFSFGNKKTSVSSYEFRSYKDDMTKRFEKVNQSLIKLREDYDKLKATTIQATKIIDVPVEEPKKVESKKAKAKTVTKK